MTNTPKTDEEIIAITLGDVSVFRNDPMVSLVTDAWKCCEDELLPVINQQAEEIEHWKKEAERMQGLYAQMIELDLTRRVEIRNLRDKNFTTLNDYREEVKMRLEAQTERDALQSRFDELVKSLEGLGSFNATVMETDGQSATFNTAEVIYLTHLQSLISKAKGQANGKV